jgi:hypothetical protein
MHDVDRPQLERPETELDRFIGPGPRGQAGRSPGARFAAAIRRLGFMPTQHFVDRINQRAAAQGIRWDPRAFPSEFANARHFRQTRPGFNSRIAVVRGVPIVYKVGGTQGNKVVLITALPPEDALPPVVPTRYPVKQELFEYETGPYRAAPPGPPMSEVLSRAVRANRAFHAALAEKTAAEAALNADIAGTGAWGDIRDVDRSIRDRAIAARAALDAARAELAQAREALTRAQMRAREMRLGSVRQRAAARRR